MSLESWVKNSWLERRDSDRAEIARLLAGSRGWAVRGLSKSSCWQAVFRCAVEPSLRRDPHLCDGGAARRRIPQEAAANITEPSKPLNFRLIRKRK